jgi:hypothetical protein
MNADFSKEIIFSMTAVNTIYLTLKVIKLKRP